MAQLPNEFAIDRARFTNNSSETETTSQSLIQINRKLPSQRWDITIRSPLLSKLEAKRVWAFLAARKQDLDTVQVEIPGYSDNDRITSTTTAETLDIGDTSMLVANSTGAEVGDYFNFGGHGKAYVVTAISGTTVEFAPSLKRSVANGESITFDGVVFTMKLRGRPLEFNVEASNGTFTRFELDMVEAL